MPQDLYQLDFFQPFVAPAAPKPAVRLGKAELNSYDRVIVAMSGGKDSVACALDILEQGLDPNKLEFWHHHN